MKQSSVRWFTVPVGLALMLSLWLTVSAQSSAPQQSAPAAAPAAPSCETSAPQPPHAIRNAGMVPIHFYRIDFKRIDGPELQTKWREW
jgi:hypothetical protein